jgi:hypothetical protein
MRIFDTVCQSAWKTKLRAELALLDREIARKEAAFGVEYYETLSAYQEGTGKSLPSMCDFVADNFRKAERAVKLQEDEKEIKGMKIRINRSATDGPAENSISDAANEAMLRLQIHALDRDIARRKEEFGLSVSRDVAEKARFWSSWGVSAGKEHDMISIRKLMEKHSADLLPVYSDRDNRMRGLRDTEVPVVASPAPPAKPKFTKQSPASEEFESLTRLEHYLERNKAVPLKAKNQVIKKGKADSVEQARDSSQRPASKPNLLNAEPQQRMTKASTQPRPVKENPSSAPKHSMDQKQSNVLMSVPTRSSSAALGEQLMKSPKQTSIFRAFASNAESQQKLATAKPQPKPATTKSATKPQQKPETMKSANKPQQNQVTTKSATKPMSVDRRGANQRKSAPTKVECKPATVAPKSSTTTRRVVPPTTTPTVPHRHHASTKVSSSKALSNSKLPKKQAASDRLEI